MEDTPEHIKQLQYEMYMNRPSQDRFMLGFNMIDEVYEMVWKVIKSRFSELSENEQKVEFIKHFYGNDFNNEEFTLIKNHFLSMQPNR